jgi:hypothetical protein
MWIGTQPTNEQRRGVLQDVSEKASAETVWASSDTNTQSPSGLYDRRPQKVYIEQHTTHTFSRMLL